MKKGQVYEGITEYVDFPDKAVVITEITDENGIRQKYHVTVKGALPGQTVKYIVKKARTGKYQGRLSSVVKKSPDETEKPACACFGACGGCSYQTLPYKVQLELKQNQVLKLVNSVIKAGSYTFDGILPSPDIWGYRNKMEFSFGDEYKGGPLSLGLHRKGNIHDIINASGCKIIHSDYSKILDCVRQYFFETGVVHYNKNTHTGVLRHLLIRRAVSTGEILIALVTTSALSSGLDELNLKLQNLKLEGSITGFLHIINDGFGDVVKSDKTHIIYGKDWITEEILGLKFRISVFSFFQTNTKGAEVLYRRARDYILESPLSGDTGLSVMQSEAFKDKVVFDLYSGTGTIAQMIAPVAKKVTGVEIVEEAVEAAKKNAEYNGLTNCEFIAGDVLKVIDEIKEKPDFIVLDPPREGIHPKALKKIVSFGVNRIVYISCKPGSLVRDLAVMQECGYKVEKISLVDLFPQTVHVETVVKLTLKKDTPKIEVTMEPNANISNYKPKERVTYQKIKDYVKEQTGLNIHTSYIAQIKEKCGLDKQYTYEKEEGKKVAKCP